MVLYWLHQVAWPAALISRTNPPRTWVTARRRRCHWDRLQQRVLSSFAPLHRLRLVDLRGLEERYPVLQSLRYDATQSFVLDCRQQDLHCILYASAQHPYHSCVCLFKAGIEKTKHISSTPLVKPDTEQLHKAVMAAARGSQVPIVRESCPIHPS